MKLTIITLSYGGFKWASEGIELYEKRLKGFLKFDCINIPPNKAKSDPISVLQEKDHQSIIKHLPKQSFVYVCDERGKQYTSLELKTLLEKSYGQYPHLVFILGPAYGLSSSLRSQYPKIAFSKMTLQHEIAQLVLTEQLYRAMTLLNNHPYHR